MEQVKPNFFIGSKDRVLFPMAEQVFGATLFVEPQNIEDYQLMHGDRFVLVKLPENDQGFGYLLNFMARYAREQGFEKYIFCDDDVKGFKPRDDTEGLEHHICEMEYLMDAAGYAQLMMSFAGHNWFCKDAVKEKVGAWCFVINRTEDILAVGGYDEELPIYNDWDMSAKLIKAGYQTACYYDAMFKHKMKSREGGAESIYRSPDKLKTAADILIERYGADCVRMVKAHGQDEVRIRWSKIKRD